MASTPTIPTAGSKAINSPKTSSAGPPSITSQGSGSTAQNDGSGQRRSGGSGSFGAGAFSRPSASPRNSNLKKSHKNSKKFRLDDDALAEAATMRSTTNRKGQTSITHLMNFSLPPRAHVYANSSSHRHGSRYGHYSRTSTYNSMDKSRYVHANYRFVVDPRRSYQLQSSDADEYLDWDDVLQILVSAQAQSAPCPICLDIPAAPRMAKCGHVFCLQCLIRFMNSEEDQARVYEKKARSKKCPLCWELIYMSEARPVRYHEGEEGSPPQEGSDVVLRLIKRSMGSTLALPRDGAEAVLPGDDAPWFSAAEVMDYARIMKGTEEYMTGQFEKDIIAVNDQERNNELMYGDDTSEWTKRAVRMLNEAKERLKGIGGPSSNLASPKDAHRSNTAGNVSMKAATSPTAGSIPRLEESTKPSPAAEYFFYQALLHYYLSPLDIRILKEAFGSFASFPATILPRVERVLTGQVVDDELRKRSKWLGHLPRGCEVCFLECDWTDTVPEDILEKFKPDIENRRKRNAEKEARDERARVKAEKDEDDKRYSHLRRRIPEDEPQKWFREDEFQPLGGHDNEAAELDMASSSPPWGSRSQQSPFESLANMSTSPSTSRTVWGTAAVASQSPQLGPTAGDGRHNDDGWLQDWEKDLLRDESELIEQAHSLSLGEGMKQPASAGKKKKTKKITLMSTNARRQA